jgi:hypothetical protein
MRINEVNMKLVILEKAKRIYVPASGNRRAYWRTDPRNKNAPKVTKKLENGGAKEWISQISDLISNARSNKWSYSSIEDFVLKNGKQYDYAVSGVRKGKMKECFMNAYHLVQRDPSLTYVEGYAKTKNLPIAVLHAWAVDKDGNVHDPTWEDGSSYFGVSFSRDFVEETIVSKGTYGVIDNYEQGFPLLSGKSSKEVK